MKEVQLPNDLVKQVETIEREIQKNMDLRYQLLTGFAYAHGFKQGDKLDIKAGETPGTASIVFGKQEIKETELKKAK